MLVDLPYRIGSTINGWQNIQEMHMQLKNHLSKYCLILLCYYLYKYPQITGDLNTLDLFFFLLLPHLSFQMLFYKPEIFTLKLYKQYKAYKNINIPVHCSNLKCISALALCTSASNFLEFLGWALHSLSRGEIVHRLQIPVS